jgi:3-deoxy-D-manno-octulosonic acid kinase
MNASIKRSTQQERRYCLVYDSCAVDDVSMGIFDPDHWGQMAKRHDEGRGSVWFITDVDRHWVLKHYLRGGLFKDLLTDRYLFTGFDRSRMIREFDMLCEMKRRSLPVPRPIAAMAVRSGPLFYRGAMITERLQNSTSLASLISCEEVSDQMWFDVGSTIGQFHGASVLHRDLNVTNILRRGGDWYLIDFDKCCFVGGGANTRWRQDNLSRFQRSIRKLSEETNQSLDQKQWRVFKEGYESVLAASQTDSGSVV